MVTFLMKLGVFQAAKMYFVEMNSTQELILLMKLQGNIKGLFIFNLVSYFFLVNYWGEGRSLGSLFCDFAVMTKSQKPMNLTQAIIRSFTQASYILMGASLVLSPLLLFPFFRKDKKAIADFLTDTQAIDLETSFNHHFETEFSGSEFYNTPLLEHLPVAENVLPFPGHENQELETEYEEEKQVA